MPSKPKNWETLSDEAREAWKAKEAERQRKWRQANREKIAEANRRYYEANREREIKRVQKWRKTNKGKIYQGNFKYSQLNREKTLKRVRKFRAKARTQSDADRFFQLMNAANEITKAISEINQSNEI